MDYTDVYFTLDGIALAGLLVAIAVACYLAHRRYRRDARRAEEPRKRIRHRRV
ncbi:MULTISPECIES: hypothetical protein [Lentisalinibacter]|uniref:hypothetical protein n=1 Tax=Lentisalinibacter TaxID=3382081 RepID=UPI00386A33D5